MTSSSSVGAGAVSGGPRRTLYIQSSPHIVSGRSVDVIMRNVVWALLPVSAFAVYAFGFAALATLTVAVASCVLTEELVARRSGGESTVSDWSAVITGLLYGLTLPPGLPLWMTAVGAVFGIGVAKVLFGGLGHNAFNPALVGRAFLQAAFPAAMTNWQPPFLSDRLGGLPSSTLALPFSSPTYDASSGPTPLSALKFDGQETPSADLVLGMTSGSTGETCALLILLGGVYLAARRMMSWQVPVAILGTVAVLSSALHAVDSTNPDAGFSLFAGGLMLGALFMATDMVATPMTRAGLWIYGGLIGLLVVVIRQWGGMPEGVMYAILFANGVSPLIDRWIQPRVYGTARKKLESAEGSAT